MIFNRGLDSWNIQLWAEYLLGSGSRTVPQPFLLNLYIASWKVVTGQIIDIFKTR